jgi:hypothetical protein
LLLILKVASNQSKVLSALLAYFYSSGSIAKLLKIMQ